MGYPHWGRPHRQPEFSEIEIIPMYGISYIIELIDYWMIAGVISMAILGIKFSLIYFAMAGFMILAHIYAVFLVALVRKRKAGHIKIGALYEIRQKDKLIRISKILKKAPLISLRSPSGYVQYISLMSTADETHRIVPSEVSYREISPTDIPLYMSEMTMTSYGEEHLKKGAAQCL